MDEFLKTLPQMGVGGIIAYIIFYFYRKQSSENLDFLKTQLELSRSMNETLINVVKENTRSATVLSEVVRSLHEHLLFDQKLSDRRADVNKGDKKDA